MAKLYIMKIESALQRALSESEKVKAVEFCTTGKSVLYAIEYFK